MMKRFGFFIGLVILACVSCVKSGDVIPNVAVNFQGTLTDPRLAALKTPNGAVLVNGYGVAGLILFREADGTYAAYDRCSSVNPQSACAVTLDNPTLTVTDPCSGAKFSLTDGTPVKAPAVRSLKSYSVNVSNFEIFVSN
jgi:nitrite reductase/ring-hydroxylating ferredoxin subunit